MKHLASYALGLFAVTSLLANPAQARPESLFAVLSGVAEVPGPGSSTGIGFAKLTIDAEEGVLCYEITVSGIKTPTLAHIHKESNGVAGPVVVNLIAPTDGALAACINNQSPAVLKDIADNPLKFYVNVHTADFPSGALRGQLIGNVASLRSSLP